MPTKNDDQDKWETWFKKVAELPNQFELPVEAILFMFTGHLDNNHRPTYSWQDEMKKLKESRTAVTLEHFFSHVRQQLFPAPTSRHQASEELFKVPEAIKSGKFQDCLAFTTYLKTLWLKLFPHEGSNERQPIQQYEACIKLHSIMSGMFELPFSIRKSNVFVHAWCKVRYDNLEIHEKYLEHTDHALLHESENLCAEYLKFLHEKLRLAQKSHNTMHTASSSGAFHSIHLASFPFDDKHKHADVHPNPMPRDPRDRHRGQKTGKRPLSAPAHQTQRKTSRTHNPPSPGNRFNAMGERGEERERTLYGANLGMHKYSQLIPGRENTTLDQAISMCKQGKCVMCGGHNHDLPTSCPSAVGNPTVLAAVRDLMKRRRAVNAAAHKNRK
jgi:hypothetical protein